MSLLATPLSNNGFVLIKTGSMTKELKQHLLTLHDCQIKPAKFANTAAVAHYLRPTAPITRLVIAPCGPCWLALFNNWFEGTTGLKYLWLATELKTTVIAARYTNTPTLQVCRINVAQRRFINYDTYDGEPYFVQSGRPYDFENPTKYQNPDLTQRFTKTDLQNFLTQLPENPPLTTQPDWQNAHKIEITQPDYQPGKKYQHHTRWTKLTRRN